MNARDYLVLGANTVSIDKGTGYRAKPHLQAIRTGTTASDTGTVEPGYHYVTCGIQ